MRRVLVLGLSGTGKTNLSRLLSASEPRCLILDPHGQYADVAVTITSLEARQDYLGRARGRFHIAYRNDEIERDAPVLFGGAYRAGHLVLVINEAGMFCSPRTISPQLKKIADHGRHPHVSFLVESRRPNDEIHHVFTSQSWELFCFRLTEPADLDFVRSFAGKEFAARIAALPPMRCLWRNLYDATEPVQELTPPLAKAR